MTQRKQKTPQKGPELAPYQILLRPIITEKTTHLVEMRNTYTFLVHPQANKDQIRDAVEELFEVRVVSVRTQNRKGKERRFRMIKGRTSATKKAYITLSENDRINLF